MACESDYFANEKLAHSEDDFQLLSKHSLKINDGEYDESLFKHICETYERDPEKVIENSSSKDLSRLKRNPGGLITELKLSSLGLAGPIAESFCKLSNLTVLLLSNNKLAGRIPNSVVTLSGLASLDLSYNQINGEIPEFIGALSNLTTLRLSYNQLNGGIPVSIGALAGLVELDLSCNQLTGLIPDSMGNLTSLLSLYLNNNQLSGPLPVTMGSLKSMAILRVSRNRLTGPIPESICSLANLESLDLSYNQITAAIPNNIGSLIKLTDLELFQNQLEGAIPETIGALVNLRSLYIHANKLCGKIPESVGALTSLTYLDLSCNQLTDVIPETIGALANLTLLNLCSNALTGVIPKGIGALKSLAFIDLSYNLFTGSIPGNISLINCLTQLYLNNNLLTGVPVTLYRLVKLGSFDLSRNTEIDCDPLPYMPEHLIKIFGNSVYGNQKKSISLYEAWAREFLLHFSCFTDQVGTENLHAIDLEKLDKYGWHPLMYAAVSGNDDLIRRLASSVDLNLLSEGPVKRLLMSLFRTDVLLADGYNGDINEITKEGWTHLGIAAESGNHTVALRLLKAGANANFTDKFGWSPLDWASRFGHRYVVDILIKNGAVVNKVNEVFDPKTGMHWYSGPEIKNGPDDISQTNGFDPHKKDKLVVLSPDGLTASIRGENTDDGCRSLVYLKQPIYDAAADEAFTNYVEFEVLQLGITSQYVGIGLADPSKLLIGSGILPGLDSNQATFCYFCDDGKIYTKWKAVCAPGPIGVGDVVGVGFDTITKAIFYTVNGKLIGMPFTNVTENVLVPVIGFKGKHDYSIQVKLRRSLCDGINLFSKHNSCSALHLAADGGFGKTVAVLLSAGAEPNILDKMKCSPLQWAAVMKQENVIIQLLKTTAKFDLDPAIPCLIDSILACRYDNVANYVRHNVNWKSSIKKVSDLDVKTFVLNYNLTDYDVISAQDFGIWITITSISEAKHVVQSYLQLFPELSGAKDDRNRLVANFAEPAIGDIIRSKNLLHGRYLLIEDRPEHKSATCSVFKATDELEYDPITGDKLHTRVCLKNMKNKHQFSREINMRRKGFDDDFVINIITKYLPSGYSNNDLCPESIAITDFANKPSLTKGSLVSNSFKQEAESLYCLVMPLGDRNLFVAIKQERFAGVNMGEVKHVFKQLLECVDHMHSKNTLHADIKPLNLVRVAGRWKLIDLDASCEIGEDAVGLKSSTAYMPPEVLFEYEGPAMRHKSVQVLCEATNNKLGLSKPLLTAHPSFDMWSLGCILYQLCSASMLFQGDLDDNLSSSIEDNDNLWDLMNWTDSLKAAKLSKITDREARNLVSRLLSKDPLKRPTVLQALAHPFISGKSAARMVGEKPFYDAFISYRVASDSEHVKILYETLDNRGYKIYWDAKCLKPGEDWEHGFCAAIVNSDVFIPFISRNAINHPTIDWQNFSKLTSDSPCDNVFLEYRLAVELQDFGLIRKIFPLFIGDYIAEIDSYNNYFKGQCEPPPVMNESDVVVKSVEEKIRHHLECQALGVPLESGRSVRSVFKVLKAHQGAFIENKKSEAFAAAADKIATMIDELKMERLLKKVVAKSNGKSKCVADDSTEDQLETLKKQLIQKDSELIQKDSELSQKNKIIADVIKMLQTL